MDIDEYKEREFGIKRIVEIIASIIIFIIGIVVLITFIIKGNGGMIALGIIMIVFAILIFLWNYYLLRKNDEPRI